MIEDDLAILQDHSTGSVVDAALTRVEAEVEQLRDGLRVLEGLAAAWVKVDTYYGQDMEPRRCAYARAEMILGMVRSLLTEGVTSSPEPSYRLWVDEKRTVMVRIWASGTVEVCRRDSAAHIWGPPVLLTEEKVAA